MATEITIQIGDTFAERHEQFIEDLGDDYEFQLRKTVEDQLHAITQEIERAEEEQDGDVVEDAIEQAE